MQFEVFHDALIDTISLNWSRGQLRITVSPPGIESKVLVFEKFNYFECPRNFPWGESSLINEISQLDLSTTQIEVQSGDLLKISAQSLVIEDFKK